MAKLAAYAAKRDFRKTAEPQGGEVESAGNSFVVQKHDAQRLHYDLRLELDGVMLSWAVTRGPSLVPAEKRLAVHVEDHPVEYNGFEGTIPKGQYGGGTVLIWDRGTWEPVFDAHQGMAKGHLEFRLEGEKLNGRFHLVRLKPRARERQESWLLIKAEDEFAREPGSPDILEEEPCSVVSGRDLDEIASAPDGAVWQSNRPPKDREPEAGAAKRARTPSPQPGEAESARADRVRGKTSVRKGRTPLTRSSAGAGDLTSPRRGEVSPDLVALTIGGEKAALPSAVEPCLATLADAVPRGERWLHEIKWDGYRLIAVKSARSVRLLTRRGHDWTTRFPLIAAAVAELPVETAILDGEAVVADASGIANFSALQSALSDETGGVARDAVLYAFDLLYLAGHDLRELALEDRKRRLAALVPADRPGAVRLSEHIEGDGEAMVRSASALGLEGVVSKRRDRAYRSGRSDDWLKIKFAERDEFAILGFVPSTATARAVGSLVLGYRDGPAWRLVGRAGSGYTAAAARDLWARLHPDRAKSAPPLVEKPTAEERRGVMWVEPRLVAEIEFRGWTGEGRLRHAAFKGLREDKGADEVVREIPRHVEGGVTEEPKRGRAVAKTAATRSAAGTARSADEVAGVPLTHPDRVLWRDQGITKRGLAEFYEEIADWLLPQIAGRPLSLVRCPSGAEGGCFFQKHSWAGLSDHIFRQTATDPGGDEEILYVRDIRGVVALVQAGVLEIHPWGATVADVARPDRIVMDLDPGDGVAFSDVIAGAREVRDRLERMALESFCKTTGGKGLHVVVPLTGRASWDEVKGFAKALADAMEADSPTRYLAKASKSARRGRIYVDYLRNGRGATAIAAYSTRARPGASVSVPLRWEELTPALKPDHFHVGNLPGRLKRLGQDPWAALTTLSQHLPTGAGRRPRTRSARS